MGRMNEIAGGLVRKDEHVTSIKAAKKVKKGLSQTQRSVYGVMKQYPDGLSDSQLRAAMTRAGYPDRKESTYRKRRTELTQKGYIEDTGREHDNGGKNPEAIWRVTGKVLEV